MILSARGPIVGPLGLLFGSLIVWSWCSSDVRSAQDRDGRTDEIVVPRLRHVTDLFVERGVVSAVNLDGGGSTAMVVRDRIVNSPSDPTGERPAADAILLFSRAPSS